MAVIVGTVVDPLPVPVAVEVDSVLEGGKDPFFPYTLSLFPAPQYSVPLSKNQHDIVIKWER